MKLPSNVLDELAFIPYPEALKSHEQFNDYTARTGDQVYINVTGGIVVDATEEKYYTDLVAKVGKYFSG